MADPVTTGLTLAWPWLLALLPLPLLARRWLKPAAGSGASAVRVPWFAMLDDSGSAWMRKPMLATLAALAWLALLLAAARPQWVGEIQTLPVTGRDLLLAVDISGSMEGEKMEQARDAGFTQDPGAALPCKWKCADESLFGVDLAIYAFTGQYPFDKGLIGGRINEPSIAAAVHHAILAKEHGAAPWVKDHQPRNGARYACGQQKVTVDPDPGRGVERHTPQDEPLSLLAAQDLSTQMERARIIVQTVKQAATCQ